MSTRAVGGVHWPDLDGLRAFAILLVLARHSLRPFVSETIYQPVAALGSMDLTPFLLNGWTGVDLFFVLSGFLIGRQAWRRDGLARFWFRRVTRIVPAYWACLTVVAVGITLRDAWPKAGPSFAAHLLMLQDYTGAVFVPAFWSLGAEEKFYLAAPLIVSAVTLLRRPRLQGVALALLWACPIALRAWAAADVSVVSYETYFATFRSPFHLTCESLVLGFTIAWLSMHVRLQSLAAGAREAIFWGGTALVLAALTPGVILLRITPATIVWPSAVVGMGFGAMVLAAVAGPGSYSRCLGWTGWRPLATGAYTLYLTHMMVMPIALALGGWLAWTRGSITQEWLSFLPWYLLLSVASAWLLHRLVERPVLQWRDRRETVRPTRPALRTVSVRLLSPPYLDGRASISGGRVLRR
jgi:peptidoglycan/LPS O-acetylase OafA/YrhL